MAVRQPPIFIVGCGPGGVDYVTPAARRAIAAAEVLVGAPRLLDALAGPGVRRIVVGANLEQALDQMAACRPARLAVLVTGDPGLCSFARPVLRRFGRKHCRVIPGVSAVQAAFAAVGVDWLDARLVTAHSRVPAVPPAALAAAPKIAVLAGHRAAHAWLAQLAQQVRRSHRIFVCENLTLPEERVRRIAAASMARLVCASHTVILFIQREIMT